MARTFSLSLVVALLLVFAITEASRGQTNQTDGQKIQNRGTTRYNSKSTTESSNLSASETRKPPRDKSSRSISNLEKHFETHFAREGSIRSRSKLKQSQAADDSTATSRTSSRHLNTSADNSQNRQKSHVTQSLKDETRRNTHDNNKKNTPESQTLKQLAASRRTSLEASPVWVDNAKLDHEVFTKSDHLRSRTGRKIYTNHGRESKDEVISSRTSPEKDNVDKIVSSSNEPKKEEVRVEHSRAENVISKANVSKKIDMKSANSSSNRKDEAKDVLLSGSESIRVDVPLTVGNAEDVDLLKSSTASSVNVSLRQTSRPIKEKVENNDIARSNAKKSRQSDRSKSRSRSKTRDPNHETANSGSTSRRGSSRFDVTAIAETNERPSSSRHRSNAKNVNSRGRSAHKSRDVTAAEARSSGRQRSADIDPETNKNKRTETRRNDRRTSEGKRRSKDGRSKAVEAKVDEQDIRTQSRSRSRAATNNLDVTTAYIPKATIAEATTVPFVNTEITTSTSATIRSSTTVRTSSTERASRNKGRDRGESFRAKEDFFNHGLGFRGRKTSTEGSSSIAADSTTTTTTTPRSETQLSRGNPGWTLRRRPHLNQDASSSTAINRDQTNEILNDSPRTTETPSTTKAGQRGTKRPKAKDESNTVSSVAAKNVTRGSKTFNKFESFNLPGKDKGVESESDNYPPAFRARLSQLKNSNLKPTEGKSTARTSLQATKPSLANLFSERSKLKLELARRLIKPELNVDENAFDVTTAAYSSKSKTKEVSTVSESRNVEKTTKAINKLIGTRVTQGSSTSAPKEKSTVRDRWKIFETRKSSKDRNIKAPFRSPADTIKKSRMTSERAVAPSFIEETSMRSVTEFNAIPRLITVSNRGAGSLKETAATTVDATKVRPSTSTTASREESSTLTNTVETIEENSIITTIESLKLDKFIETITAPDTMSITDASTESKVHPTEFLQEVTLPPTVTTPSNMLLSSTLSTAKSEKLYPVYIPDTKEYSLSDQEKTTTNDSSSVRPRYTKQEQPDKVAISMVTSRTVGPTSRYIRKKTGVFTPYDAVPKSSSTEATFTQTKRREFRPRTSTYRRHSEIPTSQVVQSATVEQTTAGVTITPKSTKYHAQVVTPSVPRSLSSEPFVNVRIDTTNNTPQVSGVTESSNGNSGNSNVFNPTRSTYLNANTTTLLEQLRSTVAPLLNNLGEKTPIFSGAYSNVNNGNSAPRITPNGSPPRFSARYKGAELFVRKPSNNQAVVPSITTSSTTASTPIEVFPTKVPEDSEAVAPPWWTNSIISTPSSDLVLNHIDANSLR